MQTIDHYDEINGNALADSERRALIDTLWVFRQKTPELVSARLVIRGFKQTVTDSDDTFASTPSMTILRLLLVLALAGNWNIDCYDVCTAFLQAPLKT